MRPPEQIPLDVVGVSAEVPSTPAWWSFSALKEVEVCARRFSLSRANYTHPWVRSGFPQQPNLAAIKGDIVHGTLEVIVRALSSAGCPSWQSSEAIDVMRELGGYTQVTTRVMERHLGRLESNPRVSSARRDQIRRQLKEWLPEGRGQVQQYLRMTPLGLRRSHNSQSQVSTSNPLGMRRPLRQGVAVEKELQAADLRLKGKVDLVNVEPDGAQLVDFKTGAEDERHTEQLRLYALLWSQDQQVNPDSIAASELVIVYPNATVRLPPPNPSQLEELRQGVVERIRNAESALSFALPVASLGDHCGHCPVRGLCSVYWEQEPSNARTTGEGDWFDLQGVVTGEHGPKSYRLRDFITQQDVLVRTPNSSYKLPIGSAVRLLNVRRQVDPDDSEVVIVGVTSSSEVLKLAT